MRRTASQELNNLREQVDAWRRQQGKRTRIPPELWDAAVQVATVNGVWATSQATRFNYEKLREMARRYTRVEHDALAVVDRGGVRSSKPPVAGPAFLELPLGGLGGSNRTVIDMVGQHGERMRVDVGAGVDVVGLVQALWSHQP
jgi:hypothetical protein